MRHFTCVAVSILLCTLHASSQGFQYDSGNEFIQVYNPLGLYGGGVSFYDFNKDGYDDLSFCINNDSIILYQNIVGTGFVRIEILPNELDAKQPTWVDYDNDGDADLMITKRSSGLKLYRNDGFPNFTDVTEDLNLPATLSAASYGCSWADYDRDGYLDCYVANYNWGDGIVNWLFHNNGNGTFDEVGGTLGVSNGSLPSYQATWVDFNFDLWPDLYVVNDKYTGNAMYRNTGFGFELISDTNGSDVELDGMSNSIADYDNDGDFDIYIANDTESNILLRNDNGFFTDVAESVGLGVNALCWGSLWIDYDNNGWEDILVNTTSPSINNNQNNFFVNQQNGSFGLDNSLGLSGNDFNSYASAKGDWNNDGFYDMIITNTLNATAALYTNQGEGKKHIRYSLEGTASNRDAVGTLIETFANGNRYIRYTMCGENYISQDSQYEIIGVGNSNVIDSVILNWPSGFVEKYYGLPAQTTYEFIEGETLTASIVFPGANNICGTDTITLDAGDWDNYFWSTGSVEQTIEVSEGGTYTVWVSNEFGIELEVSVQVQELPQPELSSLVVGPSCYGLDNGYIVLNVLGDDIQAALWNGNIEGSSIDNLGPGLFGCEVTTLSGCLLNAYFNLEYPDEILVDFETENVLCHGENSGSVELSITGGTGNVLPEWNNWNPEALAAGDYEILISDENNCQYVLDFSIEEPDALEINYEIIEVPCFGSTGSIEISIQGGIEPYSSGSNVIILENYLPGIYSYDVNDSNGCTAQIEITLEENPEITAVINSTNANNGSNGSAQILANGGFGGYSYSWSNGSQSSVASSLGQGTYTCTITDEIGCSETFEVNIIDVNVHEIYESTDVVVFPVPFGDNLIFETPSPTDIEIHSTDGKIIFKKQVQGRELIDSSQWPSGIYILNSKQKIVKL